MKKIAGIGNALIDVFVDGTDAKLEEHNLTKGAMHLVSQQKWTDYTNKFPMIFTSPGGSMCNTFSSLAEMDLKCKIITSIGKDNFGVTLKNHFTDLKIDTTNVHIYQNDATGRSLIIITPDGQRTMITHLGACSRLSGQNVSMHSLLDFNAIILEGYLVAADTSREAIERGMEIAHVQNITSVLTLSDAKLVTEYKEHFNKLINMNSNIIFGNLDEFNALLDTKTIEEVVQASKDRDYLSIITNSEKGAILCQKGAIFEIPAVPAKKVTDTTGAGDQFLAGFMAAHLKGAQNGSAGRFGSVLGSAIVEQISGIFHRDIKEIIARSRKQ